MKRVYIVLAVVFVALVSAIVWQVAQPSEPEPVYKGRTLTSWVGDLGRYRNFTNDSRFSGLAVDPEPEEAVRQIGTNGIPTLLRLLRTQDSVLKLKVMELLQRQQVIKVRFTPAGYYHYNAAYVLSLLGTNAQKSVQGFRAVPALIEIANQNISPTSQYAIAALQDIDPEAAARAGFTNRFVFFAL